MSIEEISKELKKIFSAKRIKEIAKQSKFIKRERKITRLEFIKNIIFASVKDSDVSLEYLTSLFADDKTIIIKQLLHAKMTESGVYFVKAVFYNLSNKFTGTKLFEVLTGKFSDILLVDSSEIKM